MKVLVKAFARLHLGIIDLGGDLGRLFGGIGVAINQPNVVVEAEKSERLTLKGEKTELVKPWVEAFLKKYNLEPEVTINVQEAIPQHVGLGSGTQLALATATALAKLFNVRASIQELAKTMGRGKISGVGTALFEKGGFVVEGGVKSQKNKPLPSAGNLPPVIFQEAFPSDWLFVVAIPNVKIGLSGAAETSAFDSLPPMFPQTAGAISRLILMSLLPALKEKDITTFGDALTQIQRLVGDCFAPAQHGRFSSTQSSKCVEYMLKNGAYGAGQSSWGPTVYGLVQGEKQAEQLSLGVKAFLGSTGGQVFWTAANNKGARVTTIKQNN
jgi:beta-RFAP synthase